MKWEKKGLIYQAPFDGSWRDNSALTPTPFLLDNSVIRIYVGLRDPNGISRIGFVDVEADNPKKIIKISSKPILDLGKPGCFDDNGLILGDVIKVNDDVWLYYVGFQLVQKVKFLAFSGLALSKDNGNTYIRYQDTPVMDRDPNGIYIRAIHSVIQDNDKNKFKIWFASGSEWKKIESSFYPAYHIRYLESESLSQIKGYEYICLEPDTENLEYRIGRPRVYKINDKYLMFFTFGTLDGKYQVGMAKSNDGINWERCDKELNLTLSESGWDSKHLCYPSLINVKGRTYAFYNGNFMGRYGFGYAELIEW